MFMIPEEVRDGDNDSDDDDDDNEDDNDNNDDDASDGEKRVEMTYNEQLEEKKHTSLILVSVALSSSVLAATISLEALMPAVMAVLSLLEELMSWSITSQLCKGSSPNLMIMMMMIMMRVRVTMIIMMLLVIVEVAVVSTLMKIKY
jgi:hypothetical protein